jgi:hypothetical protein
MARKNGKTNKQRQAKKAAPKKAAPKAAAPKAAAPKAERTKEQRQSGRARRERQEMLSIRSKKNENAEIRAKNKATAQADKKYLKDLGKFELSVDGKEYGYRDPSNLSAYQVGGRGDRGIGTAEKTNPNAYDYTSELYQYSPGAIREAAFRAGVSNANNKDDVAAILKEMRSPSARKIEYEAVDRRKDRSSSGSKDTQPKQSDYAKEADSTLATIDSKLDGIMNPGSDTAAVDPLTFQYAASSVVNSGNNLTIGSATDPSKTTGTDKFKRRGKKKKNRLLKQIGSSGLGGFSGPAASAAGAATSSAFGGV